MVNPVPGYSVTTRYKKTGSHWTACGWHTGQDYAAPKGTRVVAARAGVVKHVNYGSSFGSHQIAVVHDNGTEDFYAHMYRRETHNKRVAAGEWIGYVGSEGNATGPHLHFERHKRSGQWNCSNMDDPMKSHNAGVSTVEPGKVYLSKLKYGQKDSDSVSRLQAVLNKHSLQGGSTIPVTGGYFDQTDKEVRLCQQQHGFGNDKPGKSNVGPKQANHLFKGSGNTIVNDLEEPDPDPDPEPEPPVGNFKYTYTGKPSNNQDIVSGYTKITNARFKAPGDGYMLSMLYVNNKITYGTTATGGLRTKMERENPEDATAYQDFTASKNGVDGDEFLITHIWFGSADANRYYNWQLRRSRSLTKVVATTRYSKWLWVSTEQFARILGIFGSKKATIEFLKSVLAAEGEEAMELDL
jgi:hypothetical protein